MKHEIVEATEMEMEDALDTMRNRFSKIRTGKASPALLDSVKVDYYGAQTPLKQLANVGAPEPRLLTVVPFDRSTINDIEKSIRASDLGFNPVNDGNMIRVPIPELTEERRREFAKMIKDFGEDGKVAVRKVRQSANDDVKKDSNLPEDLARDIKEQVQKLTDKYCDSIDSSIKVKEAEIMEI
jgi:ribosome recycling factor